MPILVRPVKRSKSNGSCSFMRRDVQQFVNSSSHFRRKNFVAKSRSVHPSRTEANASNATQLPGFDHLFDGTTPLRGRLFWGLVIGTSLAICVMQISRRVAEYIRIPLAVHVEVTHNDTLRFPAFTICPFFPMHYSLKLQELKRQYASSFNLTYSDDVDLATKVRSTDLFDLPGVGAEKIWDLTRIERIDVNQLCQFSFNCEQNMTHEDLYTYHGICSVFSFENMVRYDGTYTGYEVNVEPDENLPHIYWRNMVLLHDSNDRPKMTVYLESGQLVHPKYESTLTFQTMQYRRVSTAESPCQKASEYQHCFWNCMDNYISRNVSCRLPYFANQTLPMCSTAAEARRTTLVTKEAYEELRRGLVCTKCPRKCVENVYTMTLDTIKPASTTYFKIMLQDNTVEVVREKPWYTFDILLSEIGGSLGLFLGMCVLGAFELLEVIAVTIKAKLLP